MNLLRRQFLQLAAGAVALPAVSRIAGAQAYPTRPIRLVVPFPPGGVNDAVGRPWADRVKGFLGTVVVENQGGAGGSTGTAAVARAQPDGYTILLGGTTVLVVNPAASSRSFYDPIKDFVPIAILGTNPGSITVRPTQPIRTLNELVAYAKTNPGKLSYGSSGVGTINHLVGERLKLLTGTDIAHIHNSVRAGFLIGACVGSCCLLRPAIGRSRADLADWRDPHGHRRTHRSVTAEAATTAATDHIGGGPEQRTGGLYRIWGWPLILMGKPEP